MTPFQNFFSAVAGAVAATLIGAWLQKPGEHNLVVEANWVPVPLEMDFDASRKIGPLVKEAERIFQNPDLSSIFNSQSIGFSQIYVVEIKNNDNKRSKNVDIFYGDFYGAIIQRSERPKGNLDIVNTKKSTSTSLGSLDPGQVVRVTVLADGAYYLGNKFNVLHDGQSVSIAKIYIDKFSPFGIASWISKHTPASDIVIFLASVVFTFMVILFVLLIVVEKNWKLRARLIGKDGIKKNVDFISFVRTNHPELMPDFVAAEKDTKSEKNASPP